MTDIIFECETEKCNNKEKNPDMFNGCKKCRGTHFKAVYK